MSNKGAERVPMPKGDETVDFVKQRKRNRLRNRMAKASRRKNRGK